MPKSGTRKESQKCRMRHDVHLQHYLRLDMRLLRAEQLKNIWQNPVLWLDSEVTRMAY